MAYRYTEETARNLDSFLDKHKDINSDLRRFKGKEEEAFDIIKQSHSQFIEILGGYLLCISALGKEHIRKGGFLNELRTYTESVQELKNRNKKNTELMELQIQKLQDDVDSMQTKMEFWRTSSTTNKEKQSTMWIAIGINMVMMFFLIGKEIVKMF